MAPVRVALVADVLVSEMGGVSRSILGLTRELTKIGGRDFELTLVATRRPKGTDFIQFRRSIAPRVPKFPGSLFAFHRPFSLRNFDIVHYIDSRPPFDFPLGRRLNVVTQHGFANLILNEPDATRRYRYMNAVLLRLARFADLTFTPSESERQELLKLSPIDPDRVIAVHHGVDHDRFFPAADRDAARAQIQSRFGISGRYVLTVANYQRKKNTERLVEAYASVRADHPDVSLVFAGTESPRFERVRQLIDEHGLQSNVHIVGHIGDDDLLRALYSCADVFALPSLHESFGMPVVEAMACGAPVLASTAYSLPEVCAGAAELVDPRSVPAIAAGLSKLLADRDHARRLATRGLEQAASLTWRKAAERHLEGYKGLIALSQSRRDGRRTK